MTASRDRETLERAEVAVVPVIATGGSIEARVEDGVKHVDDDIGASLSRAGETAGVQARVIRFARSPSFALSLEDMLRVAALARTQPPWPRTVVTCGTDLLEEMAFVLDLLAPPAGVVVTGASHDASPESDAAENLTGALLAATTDALAGGCAYVAFAERIRLGRDVIETAPPPDLFAGSTGTPVGRWTASGISVEYAAATLPFPRTEPTVRSALVVACHAALSIDHLDLVSPDVVVVEGFGAGNVPPTLAAALERRLAGGRDVVLCSTASGLPVRRVSATAGGGVRLLDAGAVSAGTLRPRKAAVLAALLLGGGVERRAFEAVVAAISEPR